MTPMDHDAHAPAMKLFWSSRSPYVRKVMVVAHEVGMAQHIQTIRTRVPLSDASAPLLGFNPLGQIPTLVLRDGQVLFDSLVICEYLDILGNGPKMVPVLPRERIDTLQRHALGNALADLCLRWLGESHRSPEQRPPGSMERRQATMVRVLDALEQSAATLTRLPPDLGHVAIASTLAYLDFRLAAQQWRHQRPQLQAWFDGFCARPSMKATAYVDDLAGAAS